MMRRLFKKEKKPTPGNERIKRGRNYKKEKNVHKSLCPQRYYM